MRSPGSLAEHRPKLQRAPDRRVLRERLQKVVSPARLALLFFSCQEVEKQTVELDRLFKHEEMRST